MPWGIAGAAGTITVSMLDKMCFDPSVLGTQQTNDTHAALMVKFPGMEHDAPYMAHVEPDKTGEIVWTFNKPGEFKFACLIVGHYQAGMIGTISVSET